MMDQLSENDIPSNSSFVSYRYTYRSEEGKHTKLKTDA
jgi:hypothetical protein